MSKEDINVCVWHATMFYFAKKDWIDCKYSREQIFYICVNISSSDITDKSLKDIFLTQKAF